MSQSIRLNRVLVFLALVFLGVLISWVLFAGPAQSLGRLTGDSNALAAPNESSISVPSDLSSPGAPTDFYQCTSSGVAVYADRIHVECTVPAPGGIRFFAMSTANSSHTARILTILSMGHVTAKPLYIEYNPNDTSGTAIGCQANDCRLILSAAILP